MADEIIDQERRVFLGRSAVALPGVVAGASATARADTPPAESTAVKEPVVIGYPSHKGATIERVTYPARNIGTAIIANLFKPAGLQASRKKSREPKEVHIIEGATHIDLYDRPQFVTPAVGKLTEFFGRHLAEVASPGTEKKEEPA